ncbi:MAG TPA: hypothetical protein VFP63_07950, partial [Dehalococcoidia bacterium]|nr:hypothetical protein [Dehalococcoidia bacterium]
MADTELDAGKSAPREEASLDFSFVVSGVWPLLLAGFIFRIIIGAIPGTAFQIDTGTFTAWSNRLADQHPWNFYSPDYFSDYAPGYLYVLWFFGELNAKLHFGPDTFEFILKLPSIFADVGTAYVLYLFLEKERPAWRLGAVAAYLLFPPALLMGAVWGQVDSLSVFFLMLSIYWISRDRPVEGAAAYVVGFVTKPQIIAALPFLAFWILRRHPPDFSKPVSEITSATWLKTAAAGFAVLLILIIPFFPDYPWDFVTHLKNSADVENYRVGSFWAYNFWGMWGFFKPDNTEYMGLTYQVWGLSLFAISMLAILYSLRDAEGDRALALGTALCLLAFYIFLTRMHERYMFPFFVPFLAACVLYRSPLLWTVFAVLAVTQFLNL